MILFLWAVCCLTQVIRFFYRIKIKKKNIDPIYLHKIAILSITALIAMTGVQFSILSVKFQLNAITQIVQIPAKGKPSSFHEGLAACNVDGIWGYIDQNGRWVIEPEYEHARNFKDGLACVKKDGFYGYINKTGEIAISIEYSDAVSFSGGLASVFDGYKWFLIDTEGMPFQNFDYSHVDTAHPVIFHDGLAAVKIESEDTYIKQDGSKAFPDMSFLSCEPFQEGLALVTLQDGQEAVIRLDGTVAFELPENIVGCSVFSEGLSVFCDLENKIKYGYIDEYGKIIIHPILDSAGHFSDGLAKVNYCGIDVWIKNPLMPYIRFTFENL